VKEINMKRTLASATLLALLAVAPGCDYTNPKAPAVDLQPDPAGGGGSPNQGGNGSSSGAATATFQQVFSQILQPKCLACHGSGTRPILSSWASFAQDTRYVLPGNPGQSDIYVQVASGAMPQSGSPLTTAELKLLSDWIAEGALNN
jgi:hypothetical protein